MKKIWIQEDIDFLINNYRINDIIYCQNKLNRTKNSIRRMASILNLCKKYISKSPRKKRKLQDRLINGVTEFICKKHGKVDFSIRSADRCMSPECKLCKRNINKIYYEKSSKSFLFKYQRSIRSLMTHHFKRVSMGRIPKGCFRHLNYSPVELYNYLENIRINQNNCCPMCNVSYDIKPFDIDHIIPMRTAKTIEQVKKLSVLKNLSLLCFYCNRYVKGGKYNG